MNKGLKRLIYGLLALALILPVQLAGADDLRETQGFRKQITLDGIREHQAALQALSDENGGNRVAGSAGYDESAQYIYDRMSDAVAHAVLVYSKQNFDKSPLLDPAVVTNPATGTSSGLHDLH